MGDDPLQVLGATIDGKYDLTDFVEHRGARYIYRANHRFWSEPVAVSLYSHDPATSTVDGETARRGYIKTGAQIAKLASKNSAIVQTRDSGLLRSTVGDLAYIVSEWIDALTLEQVLAKTREVGPARLGLSAVLDWLFDTIRSITMAHEAGMIHGALCPANIFVIGSTFRPSVPLKLRGLTDAAWRAAGIGTPSRPDITDPHYAAPEVLSSRFDPTMIAPWTDVYGLARIVTELLTGSVPPEGSAVGIAEPYISRQCLFALDRALAPNPDERFKSVEMFRSALMEGMGVRGGRSPRRTMVVADQLQDVGSAGTFEIGGDVTTTDEPSPDPDDDAPQPRVRLAFTQRVESAPEIPAPIPTARRTLAVPSPSAARARTPSPGPPSGAAEYGSGVYDQLSQDRTRTILIVVAILALGGMAAYLIVAMGAQ